MKTEDFYSQITETFLKAYIKNKNVICDGFDVSLIQIYKYSYISYEVKLCYLSGTVE